MTVQLLWPTYFPKSQYYVKLPLYYCNIFHRGIPLKLLSSSIVTVKSDSLNCPLIVISVHPDIGASFLEDILAGANIPSIAGYIEIIAVCNILY